MEFVPSLLSGDGGMDAWEQRILDWGPPSPHLYLLQG